MVKPGYQEPISEKTYVEVIAILEDNLKLIHPFVPFISEEIWQDITDRKTEEALIVSNWPSLEAHDDELIKGFEFAAEVISGIRNIRKEKNISFKEALQLAAINNENASKYFDAVISKLGNISEINYISEALDHALTFRIKANEYFIPVVDAIDVVGEIAKLRSELKYNEGFLKSVQGKLKNEKFVTSAPPRVVAIERQKEADALAKIEMIKTSLTNLK
jgi:valyl-tRNA synthetase